MPRHQFVKAIQRLGYKRIIGVDEVGRGALAGPLIVAAVELNIAIAGIDDSKRLSIRRRQILSEQIHQFAAQLSFGWASHNEIDELGLATALELAYRRCLEKTKFDLLLTDFVHLPGAQRVISAVRGDSLFYPVAAASIVAKVYRDQLMGVYHHFHLQYNWRKNVGYGTLEHRQAIKKVGPSPLHRRSFAIKKCGGSGLPLPSRKSR